MAIGPMTSVLRQLRRVVLARDAELTDAQLLDCFIARREENAFAALVRRHGPMVLSVCRRVLRNVHDAEDAFQATFLVLVRKAASVVPRRLVGNWLYGVAYRTALKAKSTNARRRVKEGQVAAMPGQSVLENPIWHDLQPLLDRELSRLPETSRTLVVLCDLEGKSRREAARQLGLAEGTVSSRLARARTLLARRLGGRGVALTGATLTALLARNAASACVPAPLLLKTIQAAVGVAAGQAATGVVSAKVAALMEGVLQSMFLAKLKIVGVLLLAASVVCLGISGLSNPALADKPAPAKTKAEKPAKADKGDKAEAKKKIGKKGDYKPDERNVHGAVKAVDTTKNTITISPATKNGKDRTFVLATDVEIYLKQGKKGEQARLVDLIPGTEVQMRLAEDKKTVERMSARGPRVYGTVKAIDAGNKTITIADKRGEKSFPLTDDVSIYRPDLPKGERGKLVDVAAGMTVSLQLTVDQKSVRDIELRMPTWHTMVEAYDDAKRMLTFTTQKGQKPTAVPLSKDVRLSTEDDDAGPNPTLKDLVKGTPVMLQLSVDGKTVAGIHFLSPSLHVALKSVDTTKGTITVTMKEEGGLVEKTFALTKGVMARVADSLDNQEVKPADLEEETPVALRLSRDRKTVLGIMAHGPSFSGTLKAVNAERGEIVVTVKEEGGFAEKVHELVKHAQISLSDGKTDRRAKLGELTEGMIVSVRLTLNKEKVVAVHARKAE
jgi:RNA polymerase sigma factor (sigma-70 family)